MVGAGDYSDDRFGQEEVDGFVDLDANFDDMVGYYDIFYIFKCTEINGSRA